MGLTTVPRPTQTHAAPTELGRPCDRSGYKHGAPHGAFRTAAAARRLGCGSAVQYYYSYISPQPAQTPPANALATCNSPLATRHLPFAICHFRLRPRCAGSIRHSGEAHSPPAPVILWIIRDAATNPNVPVTKLAVPNPVSQSIRRSCSVPGTPQTKPSFLG
jgi:hypothetical protein